MVSFIHPFGQSETIEQTCHLEMDTMRAVGYYVSTSSLLTFASM